MNAFLCGDYIMDDEFQALVLKGKKTQDEVDSMIQLANEVQYSILTKKLVPGASVGPESGLGSNVQWEGRSHTCVR